MFTFIHFHIFLVLSYLTVFMDDKESARIILSRTEPSEIKKRGRRVKNFNQELWVRCREDIVEKGNMAKVF